MTAEVEPWTDCELGDVIELKRGYDLSSAVRRSGNIPIVSSSGVSGRHSEYKAKGPGVVTGRYGTIGKVFYVEGDFWPLNTTLYVTDFKGANERFVSYFLGTLNFNAYSDKAAVPGLNRNDLHRALISWPRRPEQDRIAALLASLDAKIEHNQQTTATLEETARALFQSWFVDFDPVHAKAEGREPALPSAIAILFPDRFGDDGLPAGWRSASLLDQADWVNGAAYKNMDFVESPVGLPVIKIAELKAGVTTQTKFTNTELGDRYRITDGELLFSWSGNPQTSIETFIWTGGDAWLNQHIFAVRENGRMSKAILHTMLKWLKPVFTAIAEDKQTTGLGHVTKDDMKRLKLPVGSEALMRAFSQMVEPLFQKQYATTVETRSYIDLRDMLLPLLISGELRVPAIAQKVAAA